MLNFIHSLSQQGVWVHLDTQTLYNQNLRAPRNFCEDSLKYVNFKQILDYFYLSLPTKTLYKDIKG